MIKELIKKLLEEINVYEGVQYKSEDELYETAKAYEIEENKGLDGTSYYTISDDLGKIYAINTETGNIYKDNEIDQIFNF